MTFVPVEDDMRQHGSHTKPFRVAILGCGPAGLVAAHAVNTCGVREFGILSYARPSPLYGAQYLHAPIPGVYLPEPVMIHYQMRGTSERYRHRVYGLDWDGSVSADELEEHHYGWDIRSAYQSLWESYSDYISAREVRPRDIQGISDSVDLVINTIPLPRVCMKGHQFKGQKIWAAGDAPGLGIKIPYSCPDGVIFLNGEPEGDSPAWYRLANIYGHKTIEWPGRIPKPPIKSVAEVTKPLETNCDCHPGMMRVGRFGSWSKGVLVHQIFEQVRTKVLAMREESPV